MIPVLKQFFDRNTLYGIGGLLAVHAAAWFTQHTVWSTIPFALIVIGVLIVTKRSLVWGLAFAMLEIFVGGHGHLIDVSIGGTALGIRQGIFLAVMLGTLYHIVVKHVRPRFVAERDLPFVFLAGAIALGATWIAGSSLLLLFLFTHLPVEGIWALYGFVRDARLAEVTLLSGPAWLVGLLPNGPWYFRVFEQSQFT